MKTSTAQIHYVLIHITMKARLKKNGNAERMKNAPDVKLREKKPGETKTQAESRDTRGAAEQMTSMRY
ncbi:hypothetical protein AGMMS49974_05310 [Deltaproteobacteria bacterium]|nr:hypothetical protein AGMMS49974_05310 [Deltaproteobacteria bacterium]